jgi:hypothetical protein
MAEEQNTGKPEEPQATETPTVAIPIDGKEVNVPLTILEGIKLPLKEKGKEVPKTIKELMEGGMRQDDYSRAMGQWKKDTEAFAKEKAEFEKTKKEKETDLAAIKDMVNQLEGTKPAENEPVETGELNLTVSDDEYYTDPMGVIKKLSTALGKSTKNNTDLRKELNELKGNLNSFKTNIEDREKFIRDMMPVVKQHPWLNSESSDYNPLKYELFDARMKKLPKDATSEQFLQLADTIHKTIGDREQEIINKYLESKQEKRKETSKFTPRGGALPQDGLKIDENLTLSQAIEEAAEKLSD